MIAVSKALKQRHVKSKPFATAQVVVVEVESWTVMGFYNPPRQYEDLHALISKTLAELDDAEKNKAVAVGEFNEEA